MERKSSDDRLSVATPNDESNVAPSTTPSTLFKNSDVGLSPKQQDAPVNTEFNIGEARIIEVDAGQYYDADSDAGYVTDEAASRASTSISSSVRDYAFESNRRYHKYQEGRYQFPNDEPEQEREDMKHSMIVNLCDGKLHFAPLRHPHSILDIGTGTGIWATDSKYLFML